MCRLHLIAASVVETGDHHGALEGGRVLVSPIAVGHALDVARLREHVGPVSL